MPENPRLFRSRLLAGLVLLATPLVAASAAPSAPAETPERDRHPLDPLTIAEYGTVVRVLERDGRTDDDSRFALVTLDEPDKARLRGRPAAAPVERRAFAIVKQGPRTFEAVVDLVAGRTLSWTEVPGVQPGFLLTEEWLLAQELVRRHAGWREAIRRRGIEELDGVVPVPLTAGYFGDPHEASDRLVKVVSFDGREVGNFWGRPIEGVVAVVSLDARQVIELVDTGVVPIPRGPVDLDAAAAGEPREGPHRIDLAQPAGPSYEVDGKRVRWQRWRFHWRLDPRLGPVVSEVAYGEPGNERSILYQGSLSEMFVPYTDPDAGWYFRAYMDAGEYGVGKPASRLAPGLDCPGHATFFDALFADECGNPYVQPRVPASEREARLRIDLARPALWRVINPSRRGRLGHPVGYQLLPERNTVSLFAADGWLQRRAGFTDYHLWVTPYAPRERYAAGTYPNQGRGGEGLPRWTRADRPIADTGIVLWYTLGQRHVVRSEDWPVLPTSWNGFELRPFDFFDRNPALDLPAAPPARAAEGPE